jgi:FtsH-binding integral membrane protein
MREYLSNVWMKSGLALAVVGWGPLWIIVLLAAVGLWPDANPNPIGPGILFFVTFWPAVVCMAVGVFQVRRRRSQISISNPTPAIRPSLTATESSAWLSHPLARFAAGAVGFALVVRGAKGVLNGEGRGGSAAVVLGGVAVYWAVTGALPSWFRR